LTSEENLKVLIDDDKNFSDDELEEIFGGKHPIKTRELIRKASPDLFGNIQHIISSQYRTYLNNTFLHLLEEGEDETKIVDKVSNSLMAVNTLYGAEPLLKVNDSIGILTAFLYFHVKDESAKFEIFKNWILNNQIFNAKEVRAKSLINIFEEIISSEIKVFVAMPFFDDNEKIVADYNKIYQETISQIAKDYSINISLYPIMRNKGATQDQIQDIINKIQECKIFLADVTKNNANVSYEMGWARALKKEVIIVKRKGSEDPKSDYKNDTYHEYDDNARSTDLARVVRENIIEVLEKNYGLIKK
jgi:nucleoside 2-deoxyribosyltransferase